MNPKQKHEKAMDLSFQAKQAMALNEFSKALTLYAEASELEYELALLYLPKTELEPTRSVILRSACFLLLKAAKYNQAQELIMKSLLSISDENIKNQLNDALKVTLDLKNAGSNTLFQHYEYFKELRLNSIEYILEPKSPYYGNAVALNYAREFIDNYLKSFYNYVSIKFNKLFGVKGSNKDLSSLYENLVQPLISASSFGSFRLSIGNDIIPRGNEIPQMVEFKSKIIHNFHYDILTNVLETDEIAKLKRDFTQEDLNNIFRPLSKIRASTCEYSISFTDFDNYQKRIIKDISPNTKKRLIQPIVVDKDEIGELINNLQYSIASGSGKTKKTTILSQILKHYEFEIRINELRYENQTYLLNEPLSIDVIFDSNTAFTFLSSDFNVIINSKEYEKGLQRIQEHLIILFKEILIKNKEEWNNLQIEQFNKISELINNPIALIK